MAQQDIVTVPTDLTVLGAGMTVDQDQHPDRVLPFWVLGLMERGRMALAIDRLEVIVPKGGYYLLPPGIRHRGTERSRFTVTWWHFRGRQPGIVSLPLTGTVPEEVQSVPELRTCQRLRARGDDPRWIGLQVEALLARLASYQQGRLPQGEQPLADDLLDWLVQHRRQPWDREALERRFQRTYRTLNRVFHGRFGTGLRARHLELRIDRAKDLLLGGATLAETAEQVGFRDYFTFLRRFRAVTGTTAGRWRRGDSAP